MLLARDFEVIGQVLGLLFWRQAIRFCLTREPASREKILWLIFMIAVPGVGSLLYFLLRVPRHRY